uniref:UPAR/Ly6 domain-containing protein n=1 Tax=Parascaris univalens TaxID=6257 RepID=A0A915A868_PARUN
GRFYCSNNDRLRYFIGDAPILNCNVLGDLFCRIESTMATIFLALLLVFVILATSNALKCYVGGPTINNGTVLVPLQECGMPGSYSCIKTVDISTNLVTRQCSNTNCTQNGVVMSTGTCYNVTAGISYQTICCCYGDGCNSASTITITILSVITTTILASWMLMDHLFASHNA